MPRYLSLLLVFCLLAATAKAIPLTRVSLSPGEQCRAAIQAAERGQAIPAALLAAIGRVESGRRDPDTGTWGAWPWTINAEGQGSYFNNKADAIKAVQALQARGVRSIDVGCMQVNLMHHPDAFPNLDLAFEPAVNADYAARFLRRLHEQTSDWTQATANYHSSNPPEGTPYAAKVMAVWPEEQGRSGLPPPIPLRPGPPGLFARPVPLRIPPRMFALNTLGGGRPPPGMLQSDANSGAATRSGGAPPNMMQGGTIPAGLLPPGYMSGRMARASAEATGTFEGPRPGRSLEFYRAAPIGMTALAAGIAASARQVRRIASPIATR